MKLKNKLTGWIRTHKEETENIAGMTAFSIILFAIFYGSVFGIVVCGISALLAIGANLTA